MYHDKKNNLVLYHNFQSKFNCKFYIYFRDKCKLFNLTRNFSTKPNPLAPIQAIKFLLNNKIICNKIINNKRKN
jgi:hypothetical protein